MRKLAALTALFTVSLCASAAAHPVYHLVYKGSIDATDATGVSSPALSQPRMVALDQANQALYVASEPKRIYKINAQTYESESFSALSGTEPTSVITEQAVGELGNFAVDNSGGTTQGRIYAFKRFGEEADVVPNMYLPTGAKATSVEFKPFDKPFGNPCGMEVGPDGSVWLQFTYSNFGGAWQFPSTGGEATGRAIDRGYTEGMCGQFAIDSQENFYLIEYEYGGFVQKWDGSGFKYSLGLGLAHSAAVDREDNSVFVDDGNVITQYSPDGAQVDKFGQAEEYAPGKTYPGLTESPSLAVDEQTGDVFAVNPSTNAIDVFTRGPHKTAADVTIKDPFTTLTNATLHGVVNPDGVPTTECYFEWGETKSYGHKASCAEGENFSGSADRAVSAEIPVTVGTTYHVRLVAGNEEGLVSRTGDRSFHPQKTPIVERLFIDQLNTDSARFNAVVDPGLGDTSYRFEYGKDTGYGASVPVPDGVIESQFLPKAIAATAHGLEAGKQYFYRIVATNLGGTAERTGTFSTFPRVPSIVDSCPNALSRQQTGAALLPDCRSYELASASDTGGYNVESDLVPGQTPFMGYPSVDGELLYGTHNGGIPGTGSPTNLGVDPYLAVRGKEGWTTKYVGIPADGTPSDGPFASTLLAADQSLHTFAFGGPDICSPCFSADDSSGIPVRSGEGALAQGMAGSKDPWPAAKPDGLISKSLSADGTHLIFGSQQQFEGGGNDETGDVSIYERDLEDQTTQVVSTDPSGNPLACLQGAGACHSPGDKDGIAELDVSADGSRVIVAQKVSTDSDGNVYWHPYMHIGSDPHTVDLAPGSAAGVLFDGMTSDGSKVFFTTTDKLALGDGDSSADIYVDEIGTGGPAVPKLVSVKSNGDPSNDNACNPVTDWNTVDPGPNCDAVAIGGDAGVAPDNGTFYFLSPEVLEASKGEEDQPNLYVVKPGGTPHFVTEMDSSTRKPGPAAPTRPVAKEPVISGLTEPVALAVNDSTGDIYVEEANKEIIERFTKSGTPHPFTEGASAGTDELLKSNGESPLNGVAPSYYAPNEQIAVDNHPGSPIQGAVYVTNSGAPVSVFSADGAQLGSIEIPSACGVSVEKSSGDVYIGARGARIWKLHLISAALPISLANYEATEINSEGGTSVGPCLTAADSVGNVYTVNCGSCLPEGNPTNALFMHVFDDSSFAPPPGGNSTGEFLSSDVQSIAVDSGTNEVFVDKGPRINVLGPLQELREVLAVGAIQRSRGVAVNQATHHIYVSTRKEVLEIGYEPDPSKPIDNPAVLDAVRQSGVHHPEDFQVTADGQYAVFPSGARITAYDSFGKRQIYRYDDQADDLVCASCPPANAEVFHNASLPQSGNGLTRDGRVFFTTADPLALRDTNERLDAYEYRDGDVALVSAGTGPLDSGVYSVSEDGKDVFFFTRDRLAPGDQNGLLMRVYDAREGGGFFNVPEAPPCAASDECHGPGSQASPPAEIGSLGGTAGNVKEEKRCKHGFVKRGGKCVRKHHRRNHHRGHRRGNDR